MNNFSSIILSYLQSRIRSQKIDANRYRVLEYDKDDISNQKETDIYQ